VRTKRLRWILRVLRKAEPTDLPVVVRRASLDNLYRDDDNRPVDKPILLTGYCLARPTRYVIVVNTRLSARAQEEVVLHEYAHAVAYPLQGESRKLLHDRVWGICYARCWRHFGM